MLYRTALEFLLNEGALEQFTTYVSEIISEPDYMDEVLALDISNYLLEVDPIIGSEEFCNALEIDPREFAAKVFIVTLNVYYSDLLNYIAREALEECDSI